MFELIGLIFGGVSRLGQHWMDLKEKASERDHEFRMYEQQITLADKRYTAEAEFRRMDAQSAETQGDIELMLAGIKAQASEAKAAGGWVAQLSASVRPVLSYWLLALYTVSKLCALYLAIAGGAEFAAAVNASYTAFDGTILASVISFYFADRSLRKR
jgi:hypothetical protein